MFYFAPSPNEFCLKKGLITQPLIPEPEVSAEWTKTKKNIWEKIILDYPHWVDQSEAASHTMRHVLSLPLIPFPFALDRWKRGWVQIWPKLYLCNCVFVFVYLDVRHLGTLFLRSMNPLLFQKYSTSWVFKGFFMLQSYKWVGLGWVGLGSHKIPCNTTKYHLINRILPLLSVKWFCLS